MKVIIAGSRTIEDYETIEKAIKKSEYKISEVVSGTAKGVDRMGERWAMLSDTPIKRFPADWNTHGKSAGYIRNAEMAKYADALIAIWDGTSRGTRNMIDEARRKGLEVFVYVKGSEDIPF